MLLVAFLVIETRVAAPLVPLGIFRNRDVSSANAVGILMAAGMFAYFVFSALYLQQVLGYTPLEVGLAYLPGMVIWGACSLYSDRLVMRFGIKPPLIVGPLADGARAPALRADAGGRELRWSTSCRRRSPSASAPGSRSTRSCSPP